MHTCDILQSRAYRLWEPPIEGDQLERFGKPQKLKFTAWFNPAFAYDSLSCMGQPYHWMHVAEGIGSVKSDIDLLEKNISSRGLLNPVMVSGKDGTWHLHPGKCRVQALKRLKIKVVPAIFIVNEADYQVKDEYYRIVGQKQLNRHFTGDIAPEFRRSGIRTPKIR